MDPLNPRRPSQAKNGSGMPPSKTAAGANARTAKRRGPDNSVLPKDALRRPAPEGAKSGDTFSDKFARRLPWVAGFGAAGAGTLIPYFDLFK